MSAPRWWQRGTVETPPLWIWRMWPRWMRRRWFADRKMRRHHHHFEGGRCALPDCPTGRTGA